MCLVILCRHVLFGVNSDELRVTPRIFVYLLNLAKFLIWHSRSPLAAVGTFIDSGVLVVSLRLLWMAVVWLISSLGFCCISLVCLYGCFCIVCLTV